MAGSRWVCPHCEHAAFITDEHNIAHGVVPLALNNAEGNMLTAVTYTVCPDPECKRTTLHIRVQNGTLNQLRQPHFWGTEFIRQRLLPPTYARPIPGYVPEAIRQDYREACAIADLSPKAAATLARRALQGMVRDFHGVTGRTLHDELNSLKSKLDPTVWRAIDVVRNVGNIGAHMEWDIDVIVDVDPDESLRLIRLIEMLIKEWYVARHERERELAEIVALGEAKQEQRRPQQEDARSEGEPPTPAA